MVIVPEKDPPRVPTRDDLYNLALVYLIACAASLIAWLGMDIANHSFFESQTIDDKLKPALLIAFVFCLGMAISFYHKARVTLFITPPKEERITIKLDPNSTFTKDAFKKFDNSAPPETPPDNDPKV